MKEYSNFKEEFQGGICQSVSPSKSEIIDDKTKKICKFLTRCETPLRTGYPLEMDTFPNLNTDNVKGYQDIVLHCLTEIIYNGI